MIPPWTPDRMTEDARDQLGHFLTPRREPYCCDQVPFWRRSRCIVRILLYEFVTGGGWYSPCRARSARLAAGRRPRHALGAGRRSRSPSTDVASRRAARRALSRPRPGPAARSTTVAQRRRRARRAGRAVGRGRLDDRHRARVRRPSARSLSRRSNRPAGGCWARVRGSSRWRPTSTPRPSIWPPPACRCRRALRWRPANRCPATSIIPPCSSRATAPARRAFERVDAFARRVRRARSPSRLETFCPGTAASVACLCGPRRDRAAGRRAAAIERPSAGFAYLGGRLPMRGRAGRAGRATGRPRDRHACPIRWAIWASTWCWATIPSGARRRGHRDQSAPDDFLRRPAGPVRRQSGRGHAGTIAARPPGRVVLAEPARYSSRPRDASASSPRWVAV